MANSRFLVFLAVCNFFFLSDGQQEGMMTIEGTIFSNNDFSLYINGELIAEDPIPTAPHNAVNVTFRVEEGQDITFAIDARDLADNNTGLELGNRCVGSGGLRAVFSNGVVTNSSWVCSTYLYGPVNWRECFGAQSVRNFSLQLLPECARESTPPLEGCFTRTSEKPDGWASPGFDDTRWEYALEWNDDIVGWGLRPEGCTSPNTVISPQLDPNGNNITCPENIDWGNSKFIWRPDLVLDNHLLCRYTLKLSADNGSTQQAAMVGLLSFLIAISSIVNIF